MKPEIAKEQDLRAYLLGKLDPAEQQQLEQQLMTEDALFGELLMIEDDLIDEYLGGLLPDGDQTQFEQIFLAAPERRQKLQFAKALQRYIAENRDEAVPAGVLFWQSLRFFWQAQNPVLGWSLAAALLLVLIGGSWSAIGLWRLERQLDQARTYQPAPQTRLEDLTRQLAEAHSRSSQLIASLQREQEQRDRLEQELAVLKSTGEGNLPHGGRSQASLLSFALTPGLVRDLEGTRKILIPSGAQAVQLQLHLAGQEYPAYWAVLRNVDGGELWAQNALKPEAAEAPGVVPFLLPAGILPPGDYYVMLSGKDADGAFEDIGKYYFRVARTK